MASIDARQHAPLSEPASNNRLMLQRKLWAYAFVGLPLIPLMLFVVLPLSFSGWVSLHQWNMITPLNEMEWVGLDNYIFIFSRDTVFLSALRNTFVLAAACVGISTVLGLCFALLLDSRIAGQKIWRVIYFLPVVVSPITIGILSNGMLNQNYGIINNVLSSLGLPRQPFFASPDQALETIAGLIIYKFLGYYIVIFLAGLQGIPQEYYDAAKVDGANTFQEFRFVTLPLLRPVTLFIIVTNTIATLQTFDMVFATTRGSPANTTTTAVLHMYNTAFRFTRMGRASAMAFVLFAIILAITIIQLRLLNRDSDND